MKKMLFAFLLVSFVVFGYIFMSIQPTEAGGYVEPYDKRSTKTRDISRAITSLKEELEAIDYYNQRIATITDPSLKEIMIINRDDEKEHAAKLFEWIRRNQSGWDKELKQYLFKGPLAKDIAK